MYQFKKQIQTKLFCGLLYIKPIQNSKIQWWITKPQSLIFICLENSWDLIYSGIVWSYIIKIGILVIDIISCCCNLLFHIIKYIVHTTEPRTHHLIIKTIRHATRKISKTSRKKKNYELKTIWKFTKKIIKLISLENCENYQKTATIPIYFRQLLLWIYNKKTFPLKLQ